MPEVGPVLVAGHACLDIIPAMDHAGALEPGVLVEVGAARLAGGGAVSNTGLALHRLGAHVRLAAKVGDDAFGSLLRGLYENEGPGLAEGLIVSQGETTSYSVVISPPGRDRTFLHAPGCNATFRSRDVPDALLEGCVWMHLGYPTLMPALFAGGGAELESLFRRAKEHGLGTSLDTSLPDPESAAGRADWRAILGRVLPYVDVFLPSRDEIASMLHMGEGDLTALVEALHGMGCKVAGIKCGAEGLLVSSRRDPLGDRPEWTAQCVSQGTFPVAVAGTTGAGDATFAGFLFGLLSGQTLEQSAASACAVGACCCEQPDALSGILSWQSVQNRLQSVWAGREHPGPAREIAGE